jgi:hypothetical protein
MISTATAYNVPIQKVRQGRIKALPRWAKDYIAKGLARWRQLVAETSRKIAANSRDIAEINRSIYENNARSKEYLDYQRTRYIRGE